MYEEDEHGHRWGEISPVLLRAGPAHLRPDQVFDAMRKNLWRGASGVEVTAFTKLRPGVRAFCKGSNRDGSPAVVSDGVTVTTHIKGVPIVFAFGKGRKCDCLAIESVDGVTWKAFADEDEDEDDPLDGPPPEGW